jgi:hypothetical protein
MRRRGSLSVVPTQGEVPPTDEEARDREVQEHLKTVRRHEAGLGKALEKLERALGTPTVRPAVKQ